MSACTFFGHRECRELDIGMLRSAIENLILVGVDTFCVGHQGGVHLALHLNHLLARHMVKLCWELKIISETMHKEIMEYLRHKLKQSD